MSRSNDFGLHSLGRIDRASRGNLPCPDVPCTPEAALRALNEYGYFKNSGNRQVGPETKLKRRNVLNYMLENVGIGK